MSSYFRRIKHVPYLLWYGRHMVIHIFIGLMYAWFLRETWQELNIRYILLSVIGSVIIDIDHILYHFTYGKHEEYARIAREFLKKGQIGTYILFHSKNHKNNTGLITHNIYFLGFFLLLSLLSFFVEWKVGVILFGSTVLHLMLDITDDLMALGYLNENWKHLKRQNGGGNLITYLPETTTLPQVTRKKPGPTSRN